MRNKRRYFFIIFKKLEDSFDETNEIGLNAKHEIKIKQCRYKDIKSYVIGQVKNVRKLHLYRKLNSWSGKQN